MTKLPEKMTRGERLKIYITADFEQLDRIFDDLKLTNRKEMDELFTDIMTIYGFEKRTVSSYFIKQILKELYDEIKSINLKIASGLTDLELNADLMSVSIDNIKVDLDYELINILFLPKQVKHFEKIILGLQDEASIYLADKKDFDKFAELARKIAERDNIVNAAAIFARMLEIVDNELKENKNLKAKK